MKLCSCDFDVFQGVNKIFKPDLLIFCFVKYASPDKRFMEMLSESDRRVPVISIGLESVDATFEKIHAGDSFQNVLKKTENSVLLDKIHDMLGNSGRVSDSAAGKRKNRERPMILIVDDFALQLRQMRKC